jgi:hypothetical protein
MRLVAHLAAKLLHAHIGDSARQAAILEHPLYIQVFEHYQRGAPGIRLGFGHNATGRLVQCISPNIGDPAMQAGNFLAGFLAVAAAFLLAGKFAL